MTFVFRSTRVDSYTPSVYFNLVNTFCGINWVRYSFDVLMNPPACFTVFSRCVHGHTLWSDEDESWSSGYSSWNMRFMQYPIMLWWHNPADSSKSVNYIRSLNTFLNPLQNQTDHTFSKNVFELGHTLPGNFRLWITRAKECNNTE